MIPFLPSYAIIQPRNGGDTETAAVVKRGNKIKRGAVVKFGNEVARAYY